MLQAVRKIAERAEAMGPCSVDVTCRRNIKATASMLMNMIMSMRTRRIET